MAKAYGAGWKKLRRLALYLSPFCQAPGCNERSRDVDHIRPLHLGGETTLFNLQALCVEHHRAKSAAETRERAARARAFVQLVAWPES